ncbi:MAG: VCBS repeat-containing protein [Bacteroidota bacterium]|nr:VCBS repeat-containing protein [Bacteroidota bacterium]
MKQACIKCIHDTSYSRTFLGSCLLFISLFSTGQDFELFEPVSPKKSGILFKNTITENEEHNALTHENLYNGGGVAMGDINNDGLDDIYFISNMGYNKLYLNLGDLKFRDITNSSGTGGRDGWKTGVTMADVNGDNLIDIYVCYSGRGNPELRRNQLFINKGNLKFEEKAKEYGLDDPTYSTLGAFFDYDLDGDLDLFLVATNVKVIRGLEFDQARVTDDPYAGDKLFRNDGNHFTDVTKGSGIIANGLGYGLGVAISDINKDGWPDIYVTNDYIEPDYLYINNGNGTFTNRLTEYVQHISQSAMGNDVNDFNNDTWPDIFTSDMLSADNKRLKLLYGPENYLEYALEVMQGFYHSSMRNMLQLNNGNGTFSEIGQLAGISNTDWSWAPLFADYDNDGWKDLFITNGYFKDYTNRDFLKYKFDYYTQQARAKEKADTFMLTRHMTSTPVHHFIFKNNRDLTFTDESLQWGFDKKGFSNGAAYSDLDNDGDLDLVVSNQNETASVYRNMLRELNPASSGYLGIRLIGSGKNTSGFCSKVYVYAQNGVQYLEQMPSRGYQSCVSKTLHFGLADHKFADSVKVEWPMGKISILKNVTADQILEINEKDARQKNSSKTLSGTIFSPVVSPLKYDHTEYGSNDFERQPLLISMLSICGPIMATGDVNGDKLTDIYVGGTKENPGKLFLQSSSGIFTAARDFNFRDDFNCTDADAVFFDADNDGDQDLYVVSGGYHDYSRYDKALQDRFYMNNGSGKFSRTDGALPQMTGSKSCVCAADFDKDGDIDLFVGGFVIPGEYPMSPGSYLLINDGSAHFKNMAPSLLPDLSSGGMITDAVWIDLNKDSWPDLVTVGQFMPVRVFINEKGKKFTEATRSWFEEPEEGFWNKVEAADFDHDGNIDLVAGNFGTNSQLKSSVSEPVTLTYKDFDNNGSVDPIITYFIQGQSYPFPSRNEILNQISSLRIKFPTYESYSEARLTDMFTPENLKTATILTASELRTVLFKNAGTRFVKHILPVEAQFAPVHAIEILDYNMDGNDDLVLAGNQNAMCVRLGVMDASYGQLFEGDGKGNFTYIPQAVSGFTMTGDVRSMKIIYIKGIRYLLAGISNTGIVAYKLRSK